MNGYIIRNIDDSHNDDKIASLTNEFSKRGIKVDVLTNSNLVTIKNNEIETTLDWADFIIYLDKDIYTAISLEQAGYLVINNSDFIYLCDNKILTNLEMRKHHFDVIDTTSAPLVYKTLKEENYNFLKEMEKKYSYPLVIKKAYGSLGEGIYLVSNYEQMLEIYKENYREPLLFQKYIKEAKGESIRVLVCNKEIVGAIKRINTEGDFRSNYGKNISQDYDIDGNLREIVGRMIEELNIEYAGIDFLYDGKKYLFMEMNSNAFYEEFERVKNIDVSKLFVDMVIKLVEERNEK